MKYLAFTFVILMFLSRFLLGEERSPLGFLEETLMKENGSVVIENSDSLEAFLQDVLKIARDGECDFLPSFAFPNVKLPEKAEVSFSKGDSLLEVIQDVFFRADFLVLTFEWGVVFVPKDEEGFTKMKLVSKLEKGLKANEDHSFIELAMESKIVFHDVPIPDSGFSELLLGRIKRTGEISGLEVPSKMSWERSRNLSLLGQWTYANLFGVVAFFNALDWTVKRDEICFGLDLEKVEADTGGQGDGVCEMRE